MLAEVEILDGVGFLVVIVEFLRDEVVVLGFTVTLVVATGFLVVFITVDVAFFDGLSVVTGRLAGLPVLAVSDGTDVRLSAGVRTGFLVESVGLTEGFFVGSFVVRFTVIAAAVDAVLVVVDEGTVELPCLES